MIRRIKYFITTTHLIPNNIKKLIRTTYLKLSRKLNPLNVIIFYPSFTCNYRCPYCIIVTKNKFYRKFPKKVEHNYKEWLKVFSKLPRSRICFSGGEPFIFPSIIDFANKLVKFHEVTITTNLSQPLEKISKIDKNIVLTASLHPYMVKLDEFISKATKLKKTGQFIGVEFVAYPKMIAKIPVFKKKFDRLGMPFWIDTFVDPDYKYTNKEKEILSIYLTCKRQMGFNSKDYSKKQCYAGSKYMVVLPNGDAYACHEGMYYLNSNDFARKINKSVKREKFYMGNFFNKTFRMRKGKMFCSYPCSEACDIDNAEVKKK